MFKNSLSKDYSKDAMYDFFEVIDSLHSIAYMMDYEPGMLTNYAKERNHPAINLDEYTSLSDSLGEETAHKLLTERNIPGVTFDTTTPEWYYLPDFKTDVLYVNNIRQLLSSDNIHQRAIAYKLIGETKDSNFSNTISQSIKSATGDFAGTWNAYAVAMVARESTTELFDYLVKYEDFGDAHMIPMYLQMDTISVIKTGYAKINDTNKFAKILALQSLAILDKSERVMPYIEKSLSNWDNDIKGYAIVALGMHQKENLLQYLKPLVSIPEFKEMIITMLQNSKSPKDIKFAKSFEK